MTGRAIDEHNRRDVSVEGRHLRRGRRTSARSRQRRQDGGRVPSTQPHAVLMIAPRQYARKRYTACTVGAWTKRTRRNIQMRRITSALAAAAATVLLTSAATAAQGQVTDN